MMVSKMIRLTNVMQDVNKDQSFHTILFLAKFISILYTYVMSYKLHEQKG